MGLFRRIFHTIILLGVALPVYAAPDSNLSITPTASSGTVITAADENDRNSDITTWANAHDHNDINQLANSVQLGDGTAGDKEIGFYDNNGTNGKIRWDDSENMVVLQQFGGSDYNAIIVSSGTTDLTGGELLLGGGEGPIYSSGILASDVQTSASIVTSNIVAVARTAAAGAGSQAITGMGFQPTTLLAWCVVQGADLGSWGLVDDDRDGSVLQRAGAGPVQNTADDKFIQLSDGTDGMNADVASYDSDGFTITWTKVSSGKDVGCQVMGLR